MYFYSGGATTDKPSNLVKRFMIFKKRLNKIIFPIIRFACAACTCQLLIEDHRELNETFYNFISIITDF